MKTLALILVALPLLVQQRAFEESVEIEKGRRDIAA